MPLVVQFCDFVSVSWLVNLAGQVVSILLEYVGQVSLCGKLTKILEKHKEWPHIRRTARELTVGVRTVRLKNQETYLLFLLYWQGTRCFLLL